MQTSHTTTFANKEEESYNQNPLQAKDPVV